MTTPHETDRIVCPQSGESLVPEKVWESPVPGKQRQWIRSGRFKTHHHHGEECPYSGHVQPVIPVAPTKRE